METLKLWWNIIRPRTLFASICPVAIGLLLANSFHVGVALMTLFCALALQILSNLINDYYDFKRGSDKAGRVGPARALAEGKVTMKSMKMACWIALGIALILGGMLIYIGGWRILSIGVLAILFAWLYTATRHSLSYMGVADIFCFLFYGPVATLGTAWLLDLDSFLNASAGWAGCVCGAIAVCVLMTNNLRDREEDMKVGKKTIPVRFGRRAGEIGYLIMVLWMPVASCLAGLYLSALIVVPGLMLYSLVCRAKGKEYNCYLFRAGQLNLCYVLLVLIDTQVVQRLLNIGVLI